ncbi:MAG: AAA family ATPase, partial [Bifidobacteriaceae bacterium]|nr:AAA family ATPase [Bifidobacteriaceae bacterium]
MSDQTTAPEEAAARAVLNPGASEVERALEAPLRPKSLREFVGQQVVRAQLQLLLDAAKARGTAPDHVLFSGPPGLGKTTLSMIIAAELGVPMR